MENQLLIETGGSCLMCLSSSTSSCDDNTLPSMPFKLLMRYLKINVFEVCNLRLEHDYKMKLENLPIVAPMCAKCSTAVNEFSHLYRNWEMIRLQLDRCVKSICNRMDAEDQNKLSGESEYKQFFISTNAIRTRSGSTCIPNGGLALREETKRKCRLRVHDSVPRVIMKTPDATKNSNSRSRPRTKINKGRPIACKSTSERNQRKVYIHIKNATNSSNGTKTSTNATRIIKRRGPRGPYKVKGKLAPKTSTPISFKPFSNTSRIIELHNGNFQCPQCGIRKPTKASVFRHMKIHTGDIRCLFCGRNFGRNTHLLDHQIRKHQKEVYQTVLPELAEEGDILETIKFVRLKIKRGEDKGFGCFCCEKTVSEMGTMEMHIINSHSDAICNIYYTKRWLKETADMDFDGSSLQLNEDFQSISTMVLNGQKPLPKKKLMFPKKETKTVLKTKPTRSIIPIPVVPPTPGQEDETETFYCLECNRKFSSKYTLNRHMNVHYGNIQCEFCGKPFTRNDTLQSHLASKHQYEIYRKILPEGTSNSDLDKVIALVKQSRTFDQVGFGCFVCTRTSANWSILEAHIVASHPDTVGKMLGANDWSMLDLPEVGQEDENPSNFIEFEFNNGDDDECEGNYNSNSNNIFYDESEEGQVEIEIDIGHPDVKVEAPDIPNEVEDLTW